MFGCETLVDHDRARAGRTGGVDERMAVDASAAKRDE
jgi:hypothetical protein